MVGKKQVGKSDKWLTLQKTVQKTVRFISSDHGSTRARFTAGSSALAGAKGGATAGAGAVAVAEAPPFVATPLPLPLAQGAVPPGLFADVAADFTAGSPFAALPLPLPLLFPLTCFRLLSRNWHHLS